MYIKIIDTIVVSTVLKLCISDAHRQLCFPNRNSKFILLFFLNFQLGLYKIPFKLLLGHLPTHIGGISIHTRIIQGRIHLYLFLSYFVINYKGKSRNQINRFKFINFKFA